MSKTAKEKVAKEKAEKLVRESFKPIVSANAKVKDVVGDFADVCHQVHEYLSDTEISKLINYRYSRSRIQQWRKKYRDDNDLS